MSLNSAWRHRREDYRCTAISDCPYRGQILLEKIKFMNVNQTDEEYDPGTEFEYVPDNGENGPDTSQ